MASDEVLLPDKDMWNADWVRLMEPDTLDYLVGRVSREDALRRTRERVGGSDKSEGRGSR